MNEDKIKIKTLIKITNPETGVTYSQIVPGGLPKKTQDDSELIFDGETREEVLNKLLVNIMATFNKLFANTEKEWQELLKKDAERLSCIINKKIN